MMPIYEFFCQDCNTIYLFFSRRVDTKTIPRCPNCVTPYLSRRVSAFAVTRNRGESDGADDFSLDEKRMEQAMNLLAREAENIREDDPQVAAQLMRKLTDMTGMEMGEGMREALRRMENGQDPEEIEAELGDVISEEEPFLLTDKKGKSAGSNTRITIRRDETLYDLQPETADP